jgi:hypothetical protein
VDAYRDGITVCRIALLAQITDSFLVWLAVDLPCTADFFHQFL